MESFTRLTFGYEAEKYLDNPVDEETPVLDLPV